jgi:glycosyltransferase involved in cell wall biosynthesis
MKDLVTVVVVTHNSQEYLNIALDSIQRQTHVSIELIVSDYTSTDHTITIAKEYGDCTVLEGAKSYKEALRAAVKQAKGTHVALASAKDVQHVDRIKHQLEALNKQPDSVEACYGNFTYVDQDGRFIDRLIDEKTSDDLSDNALFIHPLYVDSILLSTEVFRKMIASDKLVPNDYICCPELVCSVRVAPRELALTKAAKPTTEKQQEFKMWLNAVAKNYQATIDVTATESAQVIRSINTIWSRAQLTNTQRLYLESLLLKELAVVAEESPIPKISVVMSMYNAEKYLRPALESILNQTYRDFEFIIIDDGSSDGSSEIVMSYDDPRIRLVQQVNHKLVYSLNKAVHLARGEYIARMDADDISMPTRLEDELALFELKPRLGLVGSFFAYIEEATGKPTSDIIAYPTKHTDVRRALYINNPFAHGSVMYRKQAFLDAGDYTSAYGPTEDYELWRRIAEKDWELELIPKVLYLYRLNSSGISSLNSTVQNENAEKIRHELWHAPYVSKSIKDTLSDATYYRQIDPAFSDQVYAQYIDLQMKITQNLLLRNWLKRGLLSSYATWRLDKSKSKILAHLIVGAILRRLHLKSSIEGL